MSADISSELKKLDGELNLQKLYNTQLTKTNSLLKDEIDIGKKSIEEVERRMKNWYVLHFEHWQNLFTGFKSNCEF